MQDPTFRALVVDDEAIARKMLTFALEQEGFSCEAANDGLQASNLLSDHTYHLVVTDLRMPNKHGHSLVVDLMADANRPVVMVHTSVDDPRITRDLMIRGVDDVVYKPANYTAFAAKAKAVVEKRYSLPNTSGTAPLSLDESSIQQALAVDDDPDHTISAGNLVDKLKGLAAVPPLSDCAGSVPIGHQGRFANDGHCAMHRTRRRSGGGRPLRRQ